MSVKEQIDKDLKVALLARDTDRVTVLRGLKSVILDAEISEGARETGLDDQATITLLQKQAKQRQESADVYATAGAQARADKELAEKRIIEQYLPEQLSEDKIAELVDQVIAELGTNDQKVMGQVIGAVKAKAKGAADGASIARIAKEKLNA